jgi:hypothetical protein
VIAFQAVGEGVQVGQVVSAGSGDPCVEALTVASGHDLRELFDVSAQGVQVGTRGPHFLEFDLLVGVEVVGQVRLVVIEHARPLGALIRQLAAQLASDLDDNGHLARERTVIHGDFTNDNVIARGTPPEASGVIDFAVAHVETPLADIGYGLWRSGRPYEQAGYLDLPRLRRFLRGYASIVRLTPD